MTTPADAPLTEEELAFLADQHRPRSEPAPYSPDRGDWVNAVRVTRLVAEVRRFRALRLSPAELAELAPDQKCLRCDHGEVFHREDDLGTSTCSAGSCGCSSAG